MEQKKIDRINELAKLAKERELTDEEKVERAALRQEYVNSVLGDLRNQLNNTYVMDEKGNLLTDTGAAECPCAPFCSGRRPRRPQIFPVPARK